MSGRLVEGWVLEPAGAREFLSAMGVPGPNIALPAPAMSFPEALLPA
jgi:hypothetical protein